MKLAYYLRSCFYPLLEIVFFSLAAIAISNGNYADAALFGLLASIALSFSVHITFHEVMHHTAGGTSYKRFLSHVITVLSGLPFDGYRIHHMNHHRYVNSIRDFSSTWRLNGNRIERRTLLSYCFGWPWYLARMRKNLQFTHRRKHIAPHLLQRTKEQKLTLMAMLLVMLATAPTLALLYVAVIYLGWSWVSLHNYIQHPPHTSRKIRSYYSDIYNRIFCNNGLHAEHHTRPATIWPLLRSEP